jgi:hypothetical protein
MDIATYILASLSENKLQKMAFEINDELHQVVNAVNMYRAIADHDMQYVWFGEFCRVLDAQTKENFYCNVLGGSRNLVETPLGYDSTSHSAFLLEQCIIIFQLMKLIFLIKPRLIQFIVIK